MQSSNTLKNLANRALAIAGLLAAVTAESAVSIAGGKSAPKEAGVWIDDTGKGAVKIEPCGSNLCGRIVWLREPLNAQGQPLTDKNNPDPAKQTRGICGLPTLGQLAPLPEGGYDGGWVYDPKVGKSYDVAIALAGPDQLLVTGYKGMKFLGKSFMWTRAKSELPPCDATQQSGAVKSPGAAKKAAAPTDGELPWAKKSTTTTTGDKAAAPPKPAKKVATDAKPATAVAKPAPAPNPAKRPEGASQLGGPKKKPALTSP